MPEERTRAARLLAERALLWILHRLGGQDIFMVVLGGLVPDVLTEGRDPPAPRHIGTTDVDVHINFHLPESQDPRVMETTLVETGFTLDPKNSAGWRWVTHIEGAPVRVYFYAIEKI